MTAELIALAEAIEVARKAANANESTARQSGVYGDLTDALAKTLYLVLGPHGTKDALYAISEGVTVQEAVDHVNSQRGPTVELSVQQTPINTRNHK